MRCGQNPGPETWRVSGSGSFRIHACSIHPGSDVNQIVELPAVGAPDTLPIYHRRYYSNGFKNTLSPEPFWIHGNIESLGTDGSISSFCSGDTAFPEFSLKSDVLCCKVKRVSFLLGSTSESLYGKQWYSMTPGKRCMSCQKEGVIRVSFCLQRFIM